ncbi:similar to Saccharomyces cerevisiae YNL008C ASI3 Putative integral membrane E3 ubiquitin ligase [Maudiozyma saulgeensis]|uniref:Similar to Saccharomyces cerevisiae YNL008C ASI3 Putative integral membrane E3 ubiquitin ligase n=1 Tax=Maudiozyma saulgeensis TaxID=1789683 RepID=A0A1X7QZG6_9SACH|nr:similar to Saccharomyces cerevisiae YNL008C ASI3 Putative integral membrane E3 ubiquitin ligase [Kazachstania saulgeensis]
MNRVSNVHTALSTGVDADAFILDHAPLYETIFYYYMGYLLSPFAMLCFLTNLILNRVIVMSSVRYKYGNHGRHSRLPLWSKVVVHGSTLILLGLCFTQLLCELDLTNIFLKIINENDDSTSIYIRLLAVIAFSHIIEAFMTTTSNVATLYDFDYSLFEMALQYYLYMVSLKHRAPLSQMAENLTHNQMLLDSLAVITNNIVIHIAELLNLRQCRLILSIVTNIIHFYYTKNNIMVILGTNRLYITYLRLFFKFIPTIIILWNIIYMSLALFIRKCFLKDISNQLQFFNELNSFYRANSDQEMTRTIMILSRQMLENRSSFQKDTYTISDSLNDVLETDVDSNGTQNGNIFISGYLNKLQTTPEDVTIQENKTPNSSSSSTQDKSDNENYKLNIPFCFTKLKWSADIFCLLPKTIWDVAIQIMMIVFIFLRIKKLPNVEDENTDKHRRGVHDHDHHVRDLNRLITSHNYHKFLTRYAIAADGNQNIEQFDLHKYLLPDNDTSPDYSLPDEIRDHNKALKAQDKTTFIPTDTDGMKDELVQLFSDFNSNMMESTENLNWYNSMYSILKYELENDKERVTRSQYGASNDETILNEVVLERWTANEDLREQVNGENSNVFDDCDDDDDDTDEELDLVCIVCLQEVRNVVFWPCRCLAICNDCRTALGSRGLTTCVACKSDVKGYTKLNIV